MLNIKSLMTITKTWSMEVKLLMNPMKRVSQDELQNGHLIKITIVRSTFRSNYSFTVFETSPTFPSITRYTVFHHTNQVAVLSPISCCDIIRFMILFFQKQYCNNKCSSWISASRCISMVQHPYSACLLSPPSRFVVEICIISYWPLTRSPDALRTY